MEDEGKEERKKKRRKLMTTSYCTDYKHSKSSQHRPAQQAIAQTINTASHLTIGQHNKLLHRL